MRETKDNLIILAFYVDVTGLNPQRAQREISEMAEFMNEEDPNSDVCYKRYFIPVQNENSRLECVYPSKVDDKLLEKYIEKLEQLQIQKIQES